MSLTVAEIIRIMDDLAPPCLGEEWDNTGLQIGDLTQTVHRILVTLEVDERVIDEAVKEKADMIISHHPMLFRPIKQIWYHHPLGKAIYKLIKNNLALFSAHTNLDIVSGGINDYLAQSLGLTGLEVLSETKAEKLFKLVVFVPGDYLEQVRRSICEAGAGHIGQYSYCTFALAGEGTFLPLEGAKPFIGEQGKIEKTAEYRLETIVPAPELKRVIQAMIKSHPYEEAAYDIYPTDTEGTKHGLGRIGMLSQSVSLRELAQKVKEVLKVDGIRVAGDMNKIVSRVAVCGGSGMSLFQAVKEKSADCYITGDLKHHDGQEALSHGISIIDAGHYATEAFYIPRLARLLKNKLAMCQVEIVTSQVNTNPWYYY